MEFKDYYATLGVGRRASADEVKAAFRRLARKHHPDVNPNDRSAEGRFQEINEAYEVLGDPDTRRKYDTLGADWKQYERAEAAGRNPFAGGGSYTGAAPGSDAAGWSATGGGRRPPGVEGVGDPFGSSSFSDFFRTFFEGASGGREPDGGRDVEQAIDLTLEEAFSGVARRLVLSLGGRRSTVEVRIPAGVADRDRVRVAGRGAPGPSGAGDLMLRVRIASHPTFTRNGRDLSMRCSIPLTTAVLGGEVCISAIDGETVRLRVPAGTQPGQVLRVRGRGMPALRADDARGDLYVTTHVELPRRLTAEARRHFEALAALPDIDGADARTPRATQSAA